MLGPTGNARKGKSFRQNEKLKYLQILEKETHKAFGPSNGAAQRPNLSDIQLYEGNTETGLFVPLENGFAWGTGTKTITNGIWIWSRPFLLMNCDGTEIAVIVLDTEGLNASHGGTKFCAKLDAQILSMTALFSSVLVKNTIHFLKFSLKNVHFLDFLYERCKRKFEFACKLHEIWQSCPKRFSLPGRYT